MPLFYIAVLLHVVQENEDKHCLHIADSNHRDVTGLQCVGLGGAVHVIIFRVSEQTFGGAETSSQDQRTTSEPRATSGRIVELCSLCVIALHNLPLCLYRIVNASNSLSLRQGHCWRIA